MSYDLDKIQEEFTRQLEEHRLRIAEIAARAEAHRTVSRPTRADLHALLDACLDLAEQQQERSGAALLGDLARETARPIAAVLAKAAYSWTEPPEPLTLPSRTPGAWTIIESHPTLWRQEVIARLSRAPHILPQRLLQNLLHELESLDQGDAKPTFLLTPGKKAGRGQDPELARKCEEILWCWIFHQRGTGRAIGEVEAEVAHMVGRTPKAVAAWRSSWIERNGAAEVNKTLAEQRARGAAGQEFMAGFDLSKIADLWNKARTKTGVDARS